MKTTKKDCVHSFCLFVKISTMEWSFLCHLLNQLFKHNYSQLLSYFIFPQCDSDGLLIIRVPTNEHFRISNATKCISNNFSPLFIHTSEQVDTEKEKKNGDTIEQFEYNRQSCAPAVVYENRFLLLRT